MGNDWLTSGTIIAITVQGTIAEDSMVVLTWNRNKMSRKMLLDGNGITNEYQSTLVSLLWKGRSKDCSCLPR